MDKLKNIIFSDKKVVVITGAGVSTLSGIADFRGKNGLYTKDDSVEYKLSKEYFLENPEDFYNFYKENMIVKGLEPNIIHQVLAILQDKGYINAIITQNIDNLHEKAGSNNVIAIHGNGEKFYCTQCKKSYSLDEYINEGYICDKCRGIIRPDVVLYDEAIDPYKRRKAIDSIINADAVIVLGSSLVVSTVANILDWFIFENKLNKNNDKLFIINDQETPYDSYANKYNEDLGNVFSNISEHLKTLDEEPCNFTILPSNRRIVVTKEQLLEAKKVKPAPEVLALMQELGMNFWGSTDDQTNESDVDQTFDMMAVPCDRAFVVAPEKAEEFINRKPNSEIRKQNRDDLNIDNSEVECEIVALPSNRMVVISKEQLLEAEKVTPDPEVLALLRCWGSDDEQINETDIVQNSDEQGPVLTKKKENK